MGSAPSPVPIQAASSDDVEAPLDPAVERVRQRLKRLIIISSTTLLVGVVAVLVAVIYRIGPDRSKGPLKPAAAEISIAGAMPAGSQLLSTALDGTLMALTFDIGGTKHVVIVDLAAGSVVRRFALEEAHGG